MQEVIKRLIEIRKKQVQFFDSIKLIIIFMALIVLCLWLAQSEWYSLLALIMWTVVIVAALINSSYKKRFNKIFDSELIAQGVSDLLNEVTYTHDLVYNNRVMADSKLFEESTLSGHENLRGEYQGLSVETIRVWIECTNTIGKKQYFSGRIFKLKNPQVMTGPVRLYTCEFPWKRPHIDGVFPIGTDDAEFNHYYEVEASNVEDVQYILRPKLTTCLKELGEKYEHVAIHFIDGYMYVALTPSKLTQEKSMLHEEYYEETLEFIRMQIKLITELAVGLST